MKSIEEQMYNAEFMANPYFISKDGAAVVNAHQVGFDNGAKWRKAIDEANPSDAVIMRILNAIGYEEESWIPIVRKNLETREE